MATGEEPNDENDELDREISELQSAEKELFVNLRPIYDVLEKIAQRKREYADKRDRLRTEQHDREQHLRIVTRLSELEAELKQANLVKSENVKLSDENRNLKQSLDDGAKFSKKQRQKISELEGKVANVSGQVQSETGDSFAVVKLQKQLSYTMKLLSKSKEEFNKMRKCLSDVQEQLTVAKQVTAATQQRELQKSGNSEQLQLELIPQHQPPACKGFLTSFLIGLC